MDDELPVEDEVGTEGESPAAPDPEALGREIAQADPRWKADVQLELGNRRWKPSLVRRVGKRTALVHIHVAERLRSYALERMALAFADGVEVHIALPLRQLYNEELLCQIVGLDPLIQVIEEPFHKKPPRLLAALADRQIVVSRATRKVLADTAHEISQRQGTANDKGKRYEAFLAFLLSQVEDFRVLERNFRTRTAEIDIVVQQRATTGRLWATLSAPLILVEAKNRSEPISQEMVSVFRTKMMTSRGGVRLGMMVSAAHVTEDASIQELKFATENLTIAFLTKREVEEWICADEPDEWLEQHFGRAMLR